MSEREWYPSGVPCWTVALQADPRRGADFYGALFGWEMSGSQREGEQAVLIARLRGREVAAIAPLPDVEPAVAPVWMTHVRVDSAEATATRAQAAGGRLVAGPMGMPPDGRVAVIADPAGAVLCVSEAETRRGAQIVNEPGAWSMSALQTDDADGAAAFYGSVFDWRTEPFGPPDANLALCRLDGFVGGEPQQPVPRDVVAVMTPPTDAVGSAHWSVDFWVEAADATAGLATELGGSVVVDPYDAPPFRQAVLADPDGATFSISQLVTPPDGLA